MNKYTEGQMRYFMKLKVGQRLYGIVTGFRDYGAFIKIGVVTGMVQLKDISYGRISDPEEKLKLHKKVDVIILEINEAKQEIKLGIKQLMPDPWQVYSTKYKEGDSVAATVVDILEYGVFLQIREGLEGLLHQNDIADYVKGQDLTESFQKDDVYEVEILKIDFEKRKMSLGLK